MRDVDDVRRSARRRLRQAVDGGGRKTLMFRIDDRILAKTEIDVPREGYLGKDHRRGDAKADGDRELQHHQRGARQCPSPACPRC